MKQPLRLGFSPSQAMGAILMAGYVLMLALNLPGHLSYDSVVQLYEGRTGITTTWAPAFYSWVLGVFDAISPGVSLYLAFSGFLATGALIALRGLRPRVGWGAAVLAALVIFTPTLLTFQGVVWKDVFFANLAIAAFVALAHSARLWDQPKRPWLLLIFALVALAAAAQARQNGIVVAVFAAAALAWVARRRGWRSSLAWGGGGLIAVVLATLLLGVLTQPQGEAPDARTDRGVRILLHYDIVGAVAAQPTLPLPELRAADPAAEQAVRILAASLYSSERVDYMARDPQVGILLWGVSDDVVEAQWRQIVLRHPGAYLEHRWEAFRWVFATPKIDSCLPAFMGVTGQADLLQTLNIPAGVEPADQALFNYVTWYLDTPLYSHVFFALLTLVCAGLLLRRGDPTDIMMVGLIGAALGFTASFAVISLACDYRYLYFLDLAAVAALLYVALDPPFSRPRRWARRD